MISHRRMRGCGAARLMEELCQHGWGPMPTLIISIHRLLALRRRKCDARPGRGRLVPHGKLFDGQATKGRRGPPPNPKSDESHSPTRDRDVDTM